MAIPDEVFVNPKIPEDIPFGQSLVVSLSGDNGDVTGSYIKTDRVGEMTHYINDTDLVGLPLVDYKCFASRFLRENANINLVPMLSAYNTDDTVAVDLNNVESYGDNIYKPETLHQLPSINPPSAVILPFQYVELELKASDAAVYDIAFVELIINSNLLENKLNCGMYFKSGNSWVSNTASGVSPTIYTINPVDYPGRPNDPVNTMIVRFEYPNPMSATDGKYRFRIMNIDAINQAPLTIKINHILTAGSRP